MSLNPGKAVTLGAALAIGAATAAHAGPTLLSESFDNIGTLTASGWAVENRSTHAVDNWFQGNAGLAVAHSGAPDSYIAANFLNASSGPLSLWLITPEFERSHAGTLTFYTRTDALNAFSGDKLDVRLSTGGTASADFTSLLFSVNTGEAVDGYPADWTRVTVNYAAGAAGDVGRLALVYNVSDINIANYIGIDTLDVSAVPEPMSLALSALALGAMSLVGRRRKPVQA